MRIRKIIKEELDDFDWTRDIVPKTEDFFIPGETYYMYRTSDPNSTKPYVFIRYDKKHSFWDKSLLVFDEGSYTPEYVEEQLDYLGLTLFDLLPDNNLNESQDDFDWVRDTTPTFDPNLVLDFNERGYVVAIWFNQGIDPSTRDYIISFADENGYETPYALIHYSEEVKALTFYPDKQMGFLKDEEGWGMYMQHVYDGEYDDVTPDNLYIIK